jgi:hypothetical protein
VAFLTNLSFETSTDGTNPDNWTVTPTSSVEQLDEFANGGVQDGFELDWGTTLVTAFTGGNSAEYQFANPVSDVPQFAETFSIHWLPLDQPFVFELVGDAKTFGDPGSPPYDGFEFWSAFEPTFDGTQALIFANATDADDFETGWNNDGYETTIPFVPNLPFFYDGHRENLAESFEFIFRDTNLAPINTSTGLVTLPAHGLTTGFVAFLGNSFGQLPSGFVLGLGYAVGVVDASTFYLETNGTPVIPSDTGTGVTFLSEPNEFWTFTITI